MSHHSRFATPSADNLGKTKAYAWYINSHAWQVKREEFWRNLADHSCYCCGTPRVPGFHVHHRTYDRFMAEDLDDLVAVCEECHDLIHDLHRHDPKWRARGLWAATDEVRRVRLGIKPKRRKPKRVAEHEDPVDIHRPTRDWDRSPETHRRCSICKRARLMRYFTEFTTPDKPWCDDCIEGILVGKVQPKRGRS